LTEIFSKTKANDDVKKVLTANLSKHLKFIESNKILAALKEIICFSI